MDCAGSSLLYWHQVALSRQLLARQTIPMDGDKITHASRPWASMNQKTVEKPRTKVKPKTQRPPLWKVILLNDDFTPREFVVLVLKAVFRMNESHAHKVMMTAHQKGACVIAVYTRDVAETKAKEATDMGRSKGYPLYFTTEKEE
jgi:ATP-dependent Clp protease adaptor protein ClpS